MCFHVHDIFFEGKTCAFKKINVHFKSKSYHPSPHVCKSSLLISKQDTGSPSRFRIFVLTLIMASDLEERQNKKHFLKAENVSNFFYYMLRSSGYSQIEYYFQLMKLRLD